MAKKKAVIEGETTEGNIQNLKGLTNEFRKGVMVPRKLVALKNRLVDLYKSKEITEDEQELMELILKKERLGTKLKHATISDAHLEIINRIEWDRCEEKCIVKTDDSPRVLYLEKDKVCRFYKDDDQDKFIVYVERLIPVRWQVTRDILDKEERGHFPPEDAYPKQRTLVHRLSLNLKEFDAWFDVVEDLLNETIETEEEFKF